MLWRIAYRIVDAKAGKREGFLKPIVKDDKPLVKFHIDHVGSMEVTKKAYNHILAVVNGFTKFVCLYPTKSADTGAMIRYEFAGEASFNFWKPS